MQLILDVNWYMVLDSRWDGDREPDSDREKEIDG